MAAFSPVSEVDDAPFTPVEEVEDKPFTPVEEVQDSVKPKGGFLDTIAGGLATVGQAMAKNELPKKGVPAITVPRFGKEGTYTRGVSEGLSGLVEGATTPEGIAAMGLIPVPGVGKVVGAAMLAAGTKAAAQLAGEASVTKNPQTIAEAAVIGGTTALGAAGELHSLLPRSAEAVKATGEAPPPDAVAEQSTLVKTPIEERTPNASQIQTPATDDGNLLPSSRESSGQVPIQEGELRVQSQTEGGIPEKTVTAASYDADVHDQAMANVDERIAGQPRPSRGELFRLYDEEYNRLKALPTPPMADVGPAMGANVYNAGGEEVNVVSNMKAVINQDRVARGEPPMPETEPRTWSDDRAIAEGRMKANPDYVPELIRELLQTPRPMSSSDIIAADLQRAYWSAELHNAYRKIEESRQDGRAADQAEAELDAAKFNGHLNDLDKAFGTGGGAASEAGRSLAAQQAGVTDDLDIIRIRLEKETALGRPLSDDELAALQKQVDEFKAAKETLSKELEKATADAATATAQRLVSEQRAAAAESALPPPQVMRFIGEVRRSVKSAADNARERLRGKVASLSLEDVKDVGLIALDNLFEIGEDFAKWSAKMLEDLGRLAEEVKPRLQEFFDNAKSARYAELDQKKVKRTPAVDRALAEESPAVRQRKIVSALKESVAEGVDPKELQKYVRSVVQTVIEDGEMEHHAIFQKTGDILRDAGVDLTEDDLQRIYGGYGKSTPAPTERAPVRMAELRGEAQKLQGLKTVLDKNTPPLATGPRRVKQSDLARRTAQQIHEAMKERGIAAQTTESQLAGALDARKNYRRNRMKDLRHEMATGRRIVKNKSVPLSDAELEALDLEYQQLKQEHNAAFPKQPLTDEQRVAVELQSLDREIAAQEAANKAGDVLPKAQRPKLSTPELEAKRDRLKALRSQRDELRDLNQEWQDRKERDALERKRVDLLREIEAKQKALAARDVKPEGARASRPAHPSLEPLLQERDALNKQIAEARKKSPDEKAADQMQRRLDAINKNISELQRKIATGDIQAKSVRVNRPLPPELETAMQAQEALQRQLRELRKKPADVKAEEEMQRRIEAANKRADEVLAKIAAGDLSTKAKPVNRPLPPELEAPQQRLEAANKRLAELRNPKKTRDQIASQAAIRYANNRIAEMQDRMARGDFEPKTPPAKPTLSSAAQAARAKMSQVKLDYERAKIKDQLDKRGRIERIMDAISRWKRTAVLTYPTILGKLTAAAGEGIMFSGLEGAVARGIPMPEALRAGATRYGRGTTIDIEAKALAETVTKYVKNFKDAIKTGNIELDLAYGKPEVMPPHMLDWIGNIHYALKTPLMQNEWSRSFLTLMRNEAKNGVDVSHPAVMERLKNQAYRYARERLFLDDNKLVDAYNRFLRSFSEPDKLTGKKSLLAKAAETAFRYEFPIVRIPTNIIKRAFEYQFGTVKGGVNLLNGLRKGLDTLSAEEKDVIVRNISRGSIGAAMMLYGWFNSKNIGGYYQPGDKKPKVPYGGMTMFDVPIPRTLLHHPALEPIQFGATAHHVFNKMLGKHASPPAALGEAAWASLLGLTEETPFAGQIKREIQNSTSGAKFVGEIARGAIPGFAQYLAGRLDLEPGTGGIIFGDPRQRKPTNLVQTVKMGIPGLRSNVPKKKTKP